MQEIKVTRCSECPFLIENEEYLGSRYTCKKGGFHGITIYGLGGDKIHPNCPIKGETITFKIGEDE